MKKLKGLCLTLIIVILSITMVMGTMAMTAFAAFTPGGANVITTPANFYTKFVYGKEYNVNGSAVTAPNGRPVVLTNGKFVANQIGAYKIQYADYFYNVKCVMENDYELRVDYAGAEIATYLQKGSELTVPAAALWFKNDDGEYEKVAGEQVNAQVEGAENAPASAATARKVKLGETGTYTVHYSANVGGATGSKYISQDYTVKVQSTFKDTTKPSLNVVNVPSEISLKSKVTLPIATATDDYDSNVKVMVSVKQYNTTTKAYTPVKMVKANANGYGETILTGDVEFDNKNTMSFYPMEKTTYQIIYTAIDDNGDEAGKSTPHTYTANCIDKSAPVLKDIADNQIPSKWGVKSVSRAIVGNETANEAKLKDLSITFPFPTYVDNTTDKLEVSFEIRDTINNQTVIKFSDINDQDGSGSKYTKGDATSNGIIPGTAIKFDKDTGLKINLADYCTEISKDNSGKTYTGDYTVTYQARDSRPNISTKTYTINLAETFSDTSAPDAKVVFEDKYLVVTNDETSFKVPALKTSDESATRLNIEYKLISGTNSIIVDGGESAKLQMAKQEGDTANKPYLIVTNSDKDKKDLYLDLTAGTLSYSVVVKDNVGNKTESNNATKAIKILKAEDFNDWTNVLKSDFTNIKNPADKKAGTEINIGSFTLEAKAGMRDFVGFEMTLTDSDKNVIPTNINFTTYFDKAGKTDNSGINYVKDIKFTPKSAGTYTLYIRIFDVTGRSTINSFEYEVAKSDNDDGEIVSGSKIPLSGNVYTTYQLKNVDVESVGIDQNKKYVVREMNVGGKFSVMGTQFTAYTEGTYSFTDGYYKKGESTLTYYNNDEKSYKITVSDAGTPAWQLQGKMPTVSKKDETVYLPYVIATAEYFNAEVTMEVKNPSGTILSVAKTEAENANCDVKIDAAGKYSFTTLVEGTYTVTYTAYYGTTSLPPQTYSIKAGDTVAPEFTLATAHDPRAVEKGTFEFKEVVLQGADKDLSDAKKKLIRYTKELKAPDGTVVFKVDETGESGRTRAIPKDKGKDAYVFDKTGIYTVEYKVFDEAGNAIPYSEKISVSAAKVNNPISTKVISTILIIVGVLLIAGVILYFVRFRKNKTTK